MENFEIRALQVAEALKNKYPNVDRVIIKNGRVSDLEPRRERLDAEIKNTECYLNKLNYIKEKRFNEHPGNRIDTIDVHFDTPIAWIEYDI